MLDLTDALSPWLDAPAWHVAFSGGLDSTVLLHLLALHARIHQAPALRAVHVHHGLQPAADAWPEHCQRICAQMGVELRVMRVQVACQASLEQAARQARYQAFSDILGPGEVLFSAQHRDDQAETLLLRLLRGAGLRGMAAMPQARSLGQGWLVRPLLGLSRAQLLRHAQDAGLSWVEDPSNQDTTFARNFLRREVIPLLGQRWSQVNQNLARSAQHLDEALGLLDELAENDLAPARPGSPFAWLQLDSLDLDALAGLTEARQRNALRCWLAGRTRLPDSRHWAGWKALRDAAEDTAPVWRLADGQLQRSNRRIWWLAGDWLRPAAGSTAWDDPDAPLQLAGNGSVRLRGRVPQGPLRIAYRQGGEQLLVAGRGHRDLKRLLNESRVPHFVRARLPLLFEGQRLLAVANLPTLSQGGWQLLWQPPTSAQGLS